MPTTETLPRRLFLFAPGAGASSASTWMQAWRGRLAKLGTVVPFDYGYMQAGRKLPDRLPALIATHGAALAAAREQAEGPAFLLGKSMGSRIGCHLSLETKVAGLICFGYPLVAASNGAVRDEVLLALTTPILFVQGTRDPLCPLEHLALVRAKMQARNELHVVEGGNHSLEIPGGKATRPAQALSDAAVLAAIETFVRSLDTAQGS
jgi:predicted alpha/beta-hydrolase family hydrolase